MSFDSIKKAEKFYKNYAEIAGFCVRKSSTKYHDIDGSKELYMRDLFCSKEGFKNSSTSNVNPKPSRGHTRLGCKAKISFVKDDQRWKVHVHVEGHAHILCTPRKTHLLRLHREILNTQKSLIDTFRGTNVSTTQVMSIMRLDSRGYGEIGCTDRDVRNYLSKT
ncbi:hypothetical protein QJS04_geneDACA004417 [Acorus gramineus]|uniref:FAR1 domain-containing protein n=1 Tax=Acorus gramineus TaxID=55184 RepID=A0AAV9B3N1_ACOGR|nr:hypothetical protein QJS04_geneDACA004417 [Acorus gramineus]